MKSLFDASFFSRNRAALYAAAGNGLIVITANGLLQKTADTTYPFAQESNFWYLTGLDEPDLILVLDAADEYLIVPGRSGSREAFDGAIDDAALSRRSGVALCLDETAGWQRLENRLQTARRLYGLQAAPAYIEQYGMYVNPARGRLAARLKQAQPELELQDLRETFAGLRACKQPAELTAIRQAIDITAAGISKVAEPSELGQYRHEFEIENDLGSAFRTIRDGIVSGGHAFAPIIASGRRACTLHNVANNARLQPGELVVIDAGAEVEHYAADITRTVCIGSPTGRQQAVYAAVQEVQAYALSLLRPGVFLKEYEQQVETYMGTRLRQLGLTTQDDHNSIRRYYPHATSHFLGLDVHDIGRYDQPLQAGMVITVEPGIYIREEAIGVRIEDDVLITADGTEVLSAGLPQRLG